MSERGIDCSDDQRQTLLSDLLHVSALFNSPVCSDVEFVVGGNLLYSHKLIVFLRVGHATLFEPFSKALSTESKKIVVENWKYEALREVLREGICIYSLIQVMQIAQMINRDHLFECAEEIAIRKLSFSNAISAAKIVNELGEAYSRLKKRCFEFIAEHYEEFKAEGELNSLDSAILCEVLTRKHQNPLPIAVRLCHVDAVKMLVSQGHNVNSPDESGRLPLEIALELWLSTDAFEGEIVNILVQSQADVNATTSQENGDSLLHIAARYGNSNHCKILLENGASPSSVNDKGETALHLACSNSHESVAKLLLEHDSVVPNLQDYSGNTALHLSKLPSITLTLLERRLNPDIPNNKGTTALHLASLRGDDVYVQYLIGNNASVDCTDYDGKTPLHYAIQGGHIQIVRFLCSLDPSSCRGRIDVNAADVQGNTALHILCQSQLENQQSLQLLCLLLDMGANCNAKNVMGRTPLHIYCCNDSDSISPVNALVSAGASVYDQDIDGNTPLHLAVYYGANSVAASLVERDSPINLRNYGTFPSGAPMTPIEIATPYSALAGTLLSHLRAPPAWTADDENSTCTLCDKSFSVSHRRHHCRHCGRLVCKACSPMKVFIPKFGITQKPVRVCSVCHSLLSFPRASEHEFLQQIPSWSHSADESSIRSISEDETIQISESQVNKSSHDDFVVPAWQSNEDFSECQCCQKSFSFSVRRHHCRLCGSLVCNKCSQRKMLIPALDPKIPKRVCDHCVNEYQSKYTLQAVIEDIDPNINN